ncbi:hypothetical protein BGZ80_001550 [Entomortierella chlamydospora]|uniref:Cytochrome b5 heme-binding domain-containing protein n=1 Tax=Entomortierella chlamydospora TaxID=101097 RepID=A0A9P6MQN8_9FUNG|nr:hypothetical protein BGZ79_007788 [Entomortierella chlamydospora]KAG0010361.1 hypothetical protein BGZ80_001550 [Entomortierella chlamydospora]
MAAKSFTQVELSQHNTKSDLYVAIHGKVYDVTGFIDEHPGGEEVLIDEAGRDATESFEDVGHSEEAREILSKLYIGEYKSDGAADTSKKTFASTPKPIPAADPTDSGSKIQYVVALAVVAGCVIWKVLS